MRANHIIFLSLENLPQNRFAALEHSYLPDLMVTPCFQWFSLCQVYPDIFHLVRDF